VLQYVVAGLVFGSLYAITASGLLVTYLSAGVLNFSFGATAYFIARLFYFLNTTHGWEIAPAVALSVFVAGPLIGLLLYLLVFRLLRLSSTLIKIVVTVGVAVTIPPIANICFGDKPILLAPGVAPRPLKVFRVFDVPVTMDQIVVYGCVVLLLIVGTGLLRYTDVGLRVRAMVDSPAMTSVSGTNPDRVAAGVWAASTFLAGLIGVVSAPIIGLDASSYTLLMIAAFAAVIAARLHSLPVAVVVGLAMGIAGSLVQYYLPPSSSLTQAAIPSIPFVVTALFLFGNVLRRGRSDEIDHVGGALDKAIVPQRETTTGFVAGRPVRWVWSLVALAAVAVLPMFLSTFWVGQVAAGVAFGIVFLSFTLVIGEGGMVWLCQVTFAGVGALATAQLATTHGWPLPLAVLGGAAIAVPLGVVIGLLSIRLGDLYLALVTLTFGLLMEQLVFTRETFTNRGNGVAIHRPDLIRTDTALTYAALGLFCLLAILVVNIRRSTTGMALSAVRASPTAARTLGISVLQMKVLIAGFGAFVAALGGAFLGLQAGLAAPSQYSTIQGFVFLAVLVSLGIRSTVAALLAGLAFTVSPALADIYLPHWFGEVPAILFGLGAILVAKYPEGSLTENVRQVRTLRLRLRARREQGRAPIGPDIVRSAES
jgi:branched-chain amino acid transport system permease protein